MRTPGLKALETLGLTREQARLVKRLAKAVDSEADLRVLIDASCPQTAAYARQCYNDPYYTGMWRRTLVLHAIDCMLGTHGVEALGEGERSDGYAPPYEYLNAGDAYATTLIYKRDTDRVFVGCWSDLAERNLV